MLMSKTILVVDDSASVRSVVGKALTDEGFTVIEACDGVDGLSKLNGQKVHLIVSDVNMPNMNGFTFVKEVKKLDRYKFTPVVMLTTEAGQTEKNAGKAAGAKAWMIKPFKPAQLLEAISKLVP